MLTSLMTDELRLAGVHGEPLDQVIPIHFLRTPSRREPGVATMAPPLGPRECRESCEGPGCVPPGGVGTPKDSLRAQDCSTVAQLFPWELLLMELDSTY